LRIVFRHILPNTMSTVIVLVTLQLPHVIITEAALSFLGLGIQLPSPSWGGMLSEGRQYLLSAWWIPVFPGICITVVVLGGNLLGDWLTDTLNPRRAARGTR
jgi:peptide/nickel transport system permease protein